jgi:hypothetical protein
MHRKAALFLLSSLVGLSVVAAGCASEEPFDDAAGPELVTQSAAVKGTSTVTLCNLPRYTQKTTVRLCGYTTPGSDGSAIASAWFTVDGGAPLPVVPGNGGFVDTSTVLPEGTHTVRLYAQSTAGNLTFDERTVTVDLTPPSLTVRSPTSADKLLSTVVNVTSAVTDVAPVRVQTQWVQSSVVDSGVGTVTHTIDLLNRGYSTLLVRATDAANNTTEVRVRVYVCFSNDPTCDAPTGSSCKTLLENHPGTPSGVYLLDPCGTGSSPYYCDMETAGGGWTVAGWQPANATTSLGLSDRGAPGTENWSKNLACIPYSEIRVFNRTHGESYAQAYPAAVWEHTDTNMVIGTAGTAFKQGTYGPAGIMMGCVRYNYSGGVSVEYACDSDAQRGAQGHLADYAGEYCWGGRLDHTWAWSDGATCSYRGELYSWGFAIR